jgi:hypothetical protein
MDDLRITRVNGIIASAKSLVALVALLVAACMHNGAQQSATTRGAENAYRAAAGGWRILDLSAFRDYRENKPPVNWSTEADGVISKSRGADDIMTKDEFGNYELTFDWKIGEKGNSGIFYRATTEYDEIYWSGSEYQLLDDANTPDGKSLLTSAGSDYALYPASTRAAKPHDEWNSSRLIVNGAHVEHWLNGTKVLDYELWSPDWKARVAASKFKAYPNYGLAKRGHIGIQGDHPGVVAFRNIRIRELP